MKKPVSPSSHSDTQAARPWHKDHLLFLRRAFAHPIRVAAIAPSSQSLGKLIAGKIERCNEMQILELGPGTGTITSALLGQGVPPNRLTTIEIDNQFFKLMQNRFPQVRTLHGDAAEACSLLGSDSFGQYSVIICGLPLLGYSPARRLALLRELSPLLTDRGVIFLLRYVPWNPVPAASEFVATLYGPVILNLPPGYMWAYSRRSDGRSRSS